MREMRDWRKLHFSSIYQEKYPKWWGTSWTNFYPEFLHKIFPVQVPPPPIWVVETSPPPRRVGACRGPKFARLSALFGAF